MTDYEKLMAGVERVIEKGGQEEALNLLLQMVQIFPDHIAEVGFQIINIMYQQERYAEALERALEYIGSDDGRIYEWIQEKYYAPFQKESEEMQKQNLENLENYIYYYGAKGENQTNALLYDGCQLLIYCKDRSVSRYAGLSDVDFPDQTSLLFYNMLNIEYLAEQIHKTKYVGDEVNFEIPVYLYYDEDIFYALIQCVDIQSLLRDRRAVILVGEDSLKRFFADPQARLPETMFGVGIGRVKGLIQEQLDLKNEKLISDKQQVAEYYSKAKEEIDNRIRQKKPRILFLTCYFTTAVQYHSRDLKLSAEKMGLDTELLIERGKIFSLSLQQIYGTINSFRPDVIFCIDHFRFEFDDIPKEIVWVCWAQDQMPYIMDSNTPHKLGNRDLILNAFISWKYFLSIGYSKERLFEAPIPANKDIYKPYKLTVEELEKYSCDICFVCHASDVDGHITNVVQKLPEEFRDMIASVYKKYQRHVYESGKLFYQEEEFRVYIQGTLLQQFGVELSDKALEYFSYDMYMWFNQKVFREVLADWILDAGFTNIKLWGNGWKKNPKYALYAMGAAQNGEILSKIYQASKIVMGNNILLTSATRTWETILSGGFYLSNYVPKEADLVDIRKLLEVGQDVIMFYGREDLIEKIRYYLKHEEERKKIIENGRNKALEKMTYGRFVEEMLSEMAECIQGGYK